MRPLLTFLFVFILTGQAFAVGNFMDYQVNRETYQGYYVSQTSNAPLVLLIHDWDGLTDYEVKRANMIAALLAKMHATLTLQVAYRIPPFFQ